MSLILVAQLSESQSPAVPAVPSDGPETSVAEPLQPNTDIPVAVAMDAAEQSGRASATVRIHAKRETVWPLISTCDGALHLVPGLVRCDVLETGGNGAWQRIRHVLNYSWYVPKVTYELKAVYERPSKVSLERTAGDLQRLEVLWTLRSDGDDTIAQYSVDLAPGFWVPRWVVRVALRRDLPTMLHTLRDRAETLQRR